MSRLMALVVPREGQAALWAVALAHTQAPEILLLKLYQNRHTPTDVDRADDYIEADFYGYAAISLAPARWTVTPGVKTRAHHEPQVFVAERQINPQLVYGYYLVGARSGRLYGAERCEDGPYRISQAGERIVITPELALRPDNSEERRSAP